MDWIEILVASGLRFWHSHVQASAWTATEFWSYTFQPHVRIAMTRLVARAGTRRADDVFFTAMSLLMLAIVLVGFAPSYFLQGVVFVHLPSLPVHLQ